MDKYGSGKKRIAELAKEMGYRSNHFARNLREKKPTQ